MQIPKQLKKKSFRFIKIIAGEKRAAEADWTLTNNYKYSEPEFKEYLSNEKAYGVVCGYGKLVIIDCDTREAEEAVEKFLVKTFSVRTGSGGKHYYYIIPDLNKKYVLEDVDNVHHGEIQFLGSQCLGPNSLHPNGKTYTVEDNIDIATIDKSTVMEALASFMKPQDDPQFCTSKVKYDIGVVANKIKGLAPKGKELVGAHPIHGSEGGENFHIDVEKGVWHCFRCQTGGDAFTLIAMLEGLIKCHDCKPGALSGDIFNKVVEIAKKKYSYVEEPYNNTSLTDQQVEKLKRKDLLLHIIKETREEGVIGNELAQLALVMKISLRYVKGTTKTSSNILLSDETGGGKDWVTTNLCKVMLTKYKTLFKATGISEKVLNYWEPLGKNSSWDGRVLYLEDPTEDTLSSQAFKVRASGNNEIATLDTERNVVYKKINGKPILIVTSLKHSIDIELMRRWDAVRVDTSKAVTKACSIYRLNKAAGQLEYNPDEVFREALRNLNPVDVVIPFAQNIAPYLPTHLIMRSQLPKLIDYIKASAALHQFSRERDAQGRVIATLDDYVFAAYIFDKLGSAKGQALNRAESAVLDFLCTQGGPTKVTAIPENVSGISSSWVYKKLDNLVERGLLHTRKMFDPAAGREVLHVEVNTEYKVEYTLPRVTKLGKCDGYFYNKFWEDINEMRKKEKLPQVLP